MLKALDRAFPGHSVVELHWFKIMAAQSEAALGVHPRLPPGLLTPIPWI